MDTGITIQVIADQPREAIEPVVERALGWFETVERVCTRFDPASEVMRLVGRTGVPVRVSQLLFEVAAFALDLAEQTDGAFDPTIGATLEQRGFNTNYRTGESLHTPVDTESASFRDVSLDRRAHTILLRQPVILDFNAVAKGLAIDLAARALGAYPDVCVEAGGDVYVRGHNAAGETWHVGIQHPRAEGVIARTLVLTDAAVCTSGDYERVGSNGETHIVDARMRGSPESDLVSVTVVAPTAMAADGLSTAAMVLGSARGVRLLESQGVGGVLIAADGAQLTVNL